MTEKTGSALKDRVAIVTGGAAGFGRAIAQRFVAEGARVAIADIDVETAHLTAQSMGERAIAIPCDVTSAKDVASAVQTTHDQLGAIDIVVNNAGWGPRNRPILDIPEDEFRKTYEINVFSIFHMVQAIVPLWRRHGGGVMINVGSTAGLRPRPGLTWYNSTKGAVHVMTKSLAVELAPDKIRVCGVAPVMGVTGMLETFMGCEDTPENRERFVSTIPLGRLAEPTDVANAVLFLASEQADFITGTILEVDGGRCV